MTEAEWLTCEDPQDLLIEVQCVPDLRVGERKTRLLSCAYCRVMWHNLVNAQSKIAVEVAEQYADGLVFYEEIWAARKAAKADRINRMNIADLDRFPAPEQVEWYSATAAVTTAAVSGDHWDLLSNARDVARYALEVGRKQTFGPNERDTRIRLVYFLRDIFGNPFRPVTFSASWRTSIAIALASQMYESRDFGAIPILADALQDAGCDSADVLDHCRAPKQVHVRGCWVVDLVLGKE